MHFSGLWIVFSCQEDFRDAFCHAFVTLKLRVWVASPSKPFHTNMTDFCNYFCTYILILSTKSVNCCKDFKIGYV